VHTPVPGPGRAAFIARPLRRRPAAASRTRALTVAELGLDMFFPALGVKPELAILGSALLAVSSVVFNFYSGSALEQRRAELALDVRAALLCARVRGSPALRSF